MLIASMEQAQFSYQGLRADWALLCDRVTPLLWSSELLVGWRLRTNLPVCKEELKPGIESFQQQDKAFNESKRRIMTVIIEL